MLRRFAAIVALAAFGLVPFIGSGSAAAAGSTWAPTHTLAIPLAKATNLGKLTTNTPLHLSVALALQNQPQLQAYIKAVSTPGSSMYGQSLTPAQFTQEYAPSASTVSSVESYLTSKGFTNLSATSNRLYVSGNATPAQADAAFDTQINSFNQPSQGAGHSLVYANIKPALVPAQFKNVLIAVLGLTDAIKMSLPATPKTATPTVPCSTTNPPTCTIPTSYWAPGFQKAYNATRDVHRLEYRDRHHGRG